MKTSNVLALLFIFTIGLFELLYRNNITDGYLALGMALFLFIYQIFYADKRS